MGLGIFLLIIFAIILICSVSDVHKKMDKILNLLQGRPIDYNEKKEKKKK